MNTKSKQKGFTLVELVIVIAVIAILAGVLIPTFSGVVEKANEAAAKEEVANAYRAYMTSFDNDGNYVEREEKKICVIVDGKYYVHIEDGVVANAVKFSDEHTNDSTEFKSMEIKDGKLVDKKN